MQRVTDAADGLPRGTAANAISAAIASLSQPTLLCMLSPPPLATHATGCSTSLRTLLCILSVPSALTARPWLIETNFSLWQNVTILSEPNFWCCGTTAGHRWSLKGFKATYEAAITTYHSLLAACSPFTLCVPR